MRNIQTNSKTFLTSSNTTTNDDGCGWGFFFFKFSLNVRVETILKFYFYFYCWSRCLLFLFIPFEHRLPVDLFISPQFKWSVQDRVENQQHPLCSRSDGKRPSHIIIWTLLIAWVCLHVSCMTMMWTSDNLMVGCWWSSLGLLNPGQGIYSGLPVPYCKKVLMQQLYL